jgi:hypothetical protein
MNHRVPAVDQGDAVAFDAGKAGTVGLQDPDLGFPRKPVPYEIHAISVDVHCDDTIGQWDQSRGIAAMTAGQIDDRCKVGIMYAGPDVVVPLPSDDTLCRVEINGHREWIPGSACESREGAQGPFSFVELAVS